MSRKDSAQHSVDRFNNPDEKVELFAPTIRMMDVVDGKMTTREKPLAFHYVFVKGEFQNVKSLCGMQNGFSFLLNPGSGQRYGIVSERAMTDFKRIAHAYQNSLPFYNLEDIDLEEGDEVEVVDGEFAGLRGIFIPKEKSTAGNIVIAVSQNLGTVVWNVTAKYIRVLKFAKNTKRQYDQIESFVPKLYRALRHYHAAEPLSAREVTALSTFCRRMEVVRLDNNKLEAKLLALMACALEILGEKERREEFIRRFEKKRTAITNDWTDSLVLLLEAVTTNNSALLLQGWEKIKDTSEKESRSQRELRDEYRHYLSLQN